MTIWFTSDWHLGHKRILDYTDRPFGSVEEMNEALVSNHNLMVGPKDTTYFLGDMIMGGWKNNIHHIDRLNGTKRLVLGNHDAPFIRKGKPNYDEVMAEYLNHFDSVVFAGMYSGFVLSHFPYEGDSHDEDRYDEARMEDEHRPLIHGHVHSKDTVTFSSQGTFQYHVGVDAHDCKPVLLSTIVEAYDSMYSIKTGVL